MKTLLTILFVSAFTTGIFSQPMSGSYTIGGSNPDFTSLQLAADALNARGVSGPVVFNIRPGTYSKNGGNNSVLLLDSTVAGLSETNRVTFQPDAAAGGTVENVILELNISNTSTADMSLVLVSLDYISFRNITFRENDASLNDPSKNRFVLFQSHPIFNPIIEGVTFEGCKFEGSNSNITKTGIDLDVNVKDITISGNTFIRLAQGVINSYFTFASTGYLIIEDNKFLAGYYFYGPTGTTIAISGEYLYIRRNILDYNGSATKGFNGILIGSKPQTKKVFIEQNLIKGPLSKAIYLDGINAQPDSFIIANNMINTYAFQVWPNEAAFGIWVRAQKASILFNTISIRGPGNVDALHINANDCKVFNNIIIVKSHAFNNAYAQYQAANLQSDYNSIYIEPQTWPNALFRINGTAYNNLAEYQSATGLDSNSTSKDIEFVSIDDLHLTDCQSQDPEIRGIPIPGINSDFDGEIRPAAEPLMGADENDTRSYDMFGDPFIFALPGTAFSIAHGKFDNLLADGLAIPDFDNNQVRLFHYNGDKTFTPSGTLQTLWPPTETKFFDVDKDGYLDLIVGFYADRLQIFFGDGAGSFPRDSILLTIGHVKGMTVGFHNVLGNNIERVFLTIDDNNFPPQRSFMGYIDNNYAGQGRIVVDVLRIPGGSIYPDTIYSVMDDLAMANLDSNPDHEIVALTVGIPSPVYIFNDTTISGTHYPFGTHYHYSFNSYSHTSSSISIADFDGDGDKDILTTGYDWDELILIKNQGNLVFDDEVIVARQTRGFVVMDYENDGDMDIVTINERLEENGISVYLNDGLGNFTVRENCYYPYADGKPWAIAASDFDLDGRTDIAITSTSDSLYVLYNLGGGTVGIRDQEITVVPASFSLSQNFPNPFNPSTTIQYSLPKAENVTLKIYNLLGEEVRTLVEDYQQAGKHSVQFNASNLASGIYFYRLQAGSFVETKKMVLLR